MIPKKIFQTHEYEYKELPKWFKQTSMSWQNLNPGWEYVYHNSEQRSDYVKTQSPGIYNVYEKLKKPHQADVWRYLILTMEGGVYADMDSFCITPMDYIIQDVPDHIEIISTETEDNEHTNNANFAAVKNSKILNECIENIINKLDRQEYPDQQIIHDCFSNAVISNPDLISKTMRARHSSTFKRSFDENSIKIDYYGQEMTYLEFLSNKNMI